jgi:hypothetical protein
VTHAIKLKSNLPSLRWNLTNSNQNLIIKFRGLSDCIHSVWEESSRYINMKYVLTSPSRSRPSLAEEEETGSPRKKQRICRTPNISLTPTSSCDGVFRPPRMNLFDEETEELLKIRKSSILQPILPDYMESTACSMHAESTNVLPKLTFREGILSSLFATAVGGKRESSINSYKRKARDDDKNTCYID